MAAVDRLEGAAFEQVRPSRVHRQAVDLDVFGVRLDPPWRGMQVDSRKEERPGMGHDKAGKEFLEGGPVVGVRTGPECADPTIGQSTRIPMRRKLSAVDSSEVDDAKKGAICSPFTNSCGTPPARRTSAVAGASCPSRWRAASTSDVGRSQTFSEPARMRWVRARAAPVAAVPSLPIKARRSVWVGGLFESILNRYGEGGCVAYLSLTLRTSDSTMPKRIQRKRTRGWRMPAGARSVTRPGRFGNPFLLTEMSLDQSLAAFENLVSERLKKEPGWLDELRGKDLACFCPEDQRCHADILIRYANR